MTVRKQTRGLRPSPQNTKKLTDFFDRTDTQDLEWEDADLKFERPEMIYTAKHMVTGVLEV